MDGDFIFYPEGYETIYGRGKMKMLIKSKLDGILMVICLLMLAVTLTANAYLGEQGGTMEYRVTVKPGDTIWTICARMASDKDNMQELVRTTMERNKITSPDQLQPGKEIFVIVKAIAEP